MNQSGSSDIPKENFIDSGSEGETDDSDVDPDYLPPTTGK